ncbi:hypothetical protein D0Z62_04485 [Providencia rettgeri]|uniref:hypothetical protein n=1 Tax=Providencia rettgeri TaxID=587 RepID=UPI001011C156|nr:hypothetical protein [Providencia rettgeri]RXN73088.1 hypothetical protein D0Z62_04485 [Providencia rettgeri]
MEKNNIKPECSIKYTVLGITDRDYFAAKLMPAIITSLNGPVVFEEYKGNFDLYAEQAYKMADAMIRAREIIFD